jgi:hypothetical protein
MTSIKNNEPVSHHTSDTNTTSDELSKVQSQNILSFG